MSTHHQIVIVGGGTGGITVAARLLNARPQLDVAIIEPSEVHYYQPIWTLVGGGVFPKEVSVRAQADFIPRGAKWIKEKVATFAPEENSLELANGQKVTWDYLVVAAGLQLNWSAVKGLEGNIGKNGICSNYSFETVDSTWKALQNFKSGNAFFTFPATTIKCGGAPQKIMWLAEHYLEKQGLRHKARIHFATAGERIFGVEKYKLALEKLVARRDIQMCTLHNLVEVDAANKKATFQIVGSQDKKTYDFEMLHVTPPQGPLDFLKKSPLVNAEGWVDVDMHNLRHVKFDNVFSLGDCSSLPTARTGAAVRKQAPVLVENLFATMDGTRMEARYDGYTSCPLVTGYGRLILAEFDYNSNPAESFPFDQARERYSMYALKAYVLPDMYWNGMLRGRA